MWIFLSDSFLSVVAHRHLPDQLLVRARARGDIERVFPGANVQHTPTADYAFRAILDRRAVCMAISDRLARIDYDNFKGSVEEAGRRAIYHDVWDAAFPLQRIDVNRPRAIAFPWDENEEG